LSPGRGGGGKPGGGEVRGGRKPGGGGGISVNGEDGRTRRETDEGVNSISHLLLINHLLIYYEKYGGVGLGSLTPSKLVFVAAQPHTAKLRQRD
jgi:hypothetical protein